MVETDSMFGARAETMPPSVVRKEWPSGEVMHASAAPSSTSRERPRGKSAPSIKSKPATLSASCWFGLTSEGSALSAARRVEGGESTTVYRPRSRARRTRPTRKLSSMFGGTLPAKTTAVAYSIRYSRRLENSLASAGGSLGADSFISVCVPPLRGAVGDGVAIPPAGEPGGKYGDVQGP